MTTFDLATQADLDALAARLGLAEARLMVLESVPPVIPPVVPPVISSPPPLPFLGTNEPAGLTLWTNRSFDLIESGGWIRGGNAGAIGVVLDSVAPISPPNVAQITYPVGFGGGYEPAFVYKGGLSALGYTKVYTRFGVKISANWQGHGSLVNKIGFLWMHGNPLVYWVMTGSGSDPLAPRIWLQGTPNDPIGGLKCNVAPNAEFTRGAWHVWETYLDSKAGIARWWLDGVLVADWSNIAFGSAGQSLVFGDELSWRPIWGGIGETIVQAQYMWMDHFYLSGAA